MTLPLSGLITAEMINAEMFRASNAPMSMNDPEVRRLAGKPTGLITFADFYGKTYEILATTSANVLNGKVQDFFTPAEWVSPAPKRLVNNHAFYSADPTIPGLVSGTGFFGTVTIENRGQILGGPGAQNGGIGGDAFKGEQDGITILNYGNIFGGGGGGGRGANGGAGTFPGVVSEGPFYPTQYRMSTTNQRYKDDPEDNNPSNHPGGAIVWAGVTIGGTDAYGNPNWPGYTALINGTAFTNGSFTYRKGALNYSGTSNGIAMYQWAISREYGVTNNSLGGVGGNGGFGTSLTGGSTVGANPSAPGTNAGAGGKGGNGGGWGLSGAAGAAGVAGNNGAAGSPGAGGVAGRAIWNSVGTVTLVANSGSDVRGR